MIFTLAVAGPGEGLFVSDTTATEREALRKLGYVDSPLFGDLPDVEGNRNRIYTIRFDREYILDRIANHGGRFEVTLPVETVLTAGQRYYWGVEAVTPATSTCM